MTHPFHNYVAQQVARRLKDRKIVCFYDPRDEFVQFMDELDVADGDTRGFVARFGDQQAAVVRFSGSYFGVRAQVEPLVCMDQPDSLVIYLPGVERDRTGSILMELELGGSCFDPQLKRLARNVLLKRFTDGEIDKMLATDGLTYQDVVGFLEGAEGGAASILKVLYKGLDTVRLMASWLADESRDVQVQSKGALGELRDLMEMRLGLNTDGDVPLAELRAKVVRYVLVNEFRADLDCEAPAALSMIPTPATAEQTSRVSAVAQAMREHHADAYPALADQVELELALPSMGVKPSTLGRIDTFRFEERALLEHCGERIAVGGHGDALETVRERHRSFWVDRDVNRQSQWEALRRLGELGLQVEVVRKRLGRIGNSPADWVRAYTADAGWHIVDRCYRQIEAHVSAMAEEPEAEKAVGVVSQDYEQLLRTMADGFSTALRDAHWTVEDVLHQTRVYTEAVEGLPGKVAYFLVDAMRYEMGAELAQHLSDAEDVSLRPAVTALPSITPVGMAALLPGASASFSVVESKGKLAARIESADLAGVQDRTKYFKSQRPDCADITLGSLLGNTLGKARKSIGKSNLIVVRSQEIDAFGETGDDLMYRQAMSMLVGNLAKAIKKLAKLGVERFVVSADHGHQFSLRKGEDMRTDNPGGAKLELHRRCWIGRGGSTPPGTVRLQAADLGYASDLEFVFPLGLGVFRAGGGLRFHHGGFSLQELVVPVLSLRMPIHEPEKPKGIQVAVEGYPMEVTNRILSIRIHVDGGLFQRDPVPLRPVLVSGGEQVGHVGMAHDAAHDRTTGCVSVQPRIEASVGMMLTNDNCDSLRIVIQDPSTDAILFETDDLPVKLGI